MKDTQRNTHYMMIYFKIPDGIKTFFIPITIAKSVVQIQTIINNYFSKIQLTIHVKVYIEIFFTTSYNSSLITFTKQLYFLNDY